jgi:hypothetical protein
MIVEIMGVIDESLFQSAFAVGQGVHHPALAFRQVKLRCFDVIRFANALFGGKSIVTKVI